MPEIDCVVNPKSSFHTFESEIPVLLAPHTKIWTMLQENCKRVNHKMVRTHNANKELWRGHKKADTILDEVNEKCSTILAI